MNNNNGKKIYKFKSGELDIMYNFLVNEVGKENLKIIGLEKIIVNGKENIEKINKKIKKGGPINIINLGGGGVVGVVIDKIKRENNGFCDSGDDGYDEERERRMFEEEQYYGGIDEEDENKEME